MANGGWANSQHGVGPGEGLLDLAPLLPFIELEALGEVTFLGRRAIHILARDRPIGDPYVETRIGYHRLGSSADGYDVLVNAERGVALRVEQRRSGRPFRINADTPRAAARSRRAADPRPPRSRRPAR
jgi:hypothetical protein